MIGCGWVAQHGHLPALARLEEAEVVAVADLDPVRLNRVGDSFGIRRRHSDHRRLLEDPDVEAVGICVPTEFHVEVAIAAAEAGKHLLLEKPPALSLGDWDRFADHLKAAEVTFMLGLNMRRHAAFSAARDLVRSGELGEVQSLRTVIANDWLNRPDARGWRRGRARGGGALMEMGVHHLDLWRFLLDAEIEEVFATARGDDETLALTGRMANGVPVASLLSHRTADVNEIEIYGDAGIVKVSPHTAPRLLKVTQPPWAIGARLADAAATLSPSHALRVRRAGGFFVASFAAEWRHFLRGVASASAVEPGVDSGRRLLQALLAAAASASENRPLACADAPPDLAPSPRL